MLSCGFIMRLPFDTDSVSVAPLRAIPSRASTTARRLDRQLRPTETAYYTARRRRGIMPLCGRARTAWREISLRSGRCELNRIGRPPGRPSCCRPWPSGCQGQRRDARAWPKASAPSAFDQSFETSSRLTSTGHNAPTVADAAARSRSMAAPCPGRLRCRPCALDQSAALCVIPAHAIGPGRICRPLSAASKSTCTASETFSNLSLTQPPWQR